MLYMFISNSCFSLLVTFIYDYWAKALTFQSMASMFGFWAVYSELSGNKTSTFRLVLLIGRLLVNCRVKLTGTPTLEGSNPTRRQRLKRSRSSSASRSWWASKCVGRVNQFSCQHLPSDTARPPDSVAVAGGDSPVSCVFDNIGFSY